jgi:sulfate transport system permease protein
VTITTPLQIEILYNQYDLPAAFSLAAVLAGLALLTVAARSVLEWRQRRAVQAGQDAALATA